jgi:tetratricopeptide (TPR) repeat protein
MGIRVQNRLVTILQLICLMGIVSVVSVEVVAQKGATEYDVRHYRIDAQLIPSAQVLQARTEVSFTPAADTRSVVFEMNGSLTIKRITRPDLQPERQLSGAGGDEPALANPAVRDGASRDAKARAARDSKAQPVSPPALPPALKAAASSRSGQPAPAAPTLPAGPVAESAGLQFIQDNRENMNVRIDLGSVVPAGREVTLIFEYEGALESAQGGPLSNARLALVSEQGSYLFYAARWFPFHDYAADRATFQIRVQVPKGDVVAGYSESPVTVEQLSVPTTAKSTAQGGPGQGTAVKPGSAGSPAMSGAAGEFSIFTFNSTKPVLPGSLAAGKYLIRSSNVGGFLIDFYVKAGDEKWAEHAAEVIGQHLEYYSEKFGEYAFGRKLIVVETDDETLEAYSGAGILFLSPRVLTAGLDEKLAREVAYQWWGQTVGLKSFDDTLLSQGLAEFSTILYVIDRENETLSKQSLQAELEKALAFEQSASIRSAPSQLDDQSAAFRSVIFYKGALVLSMLRQLMGAETFDRMLRDYYKAYTGRNITLDEFESFASKAAGRDLRFFFGQWIDSTGVPEFRADYRVLRTRDGFRVPGTVRQDLDTFEMPVEILLRTESGNERQTLAMKGTSADFDILSKSKPLEVIVDPDARLLRSSEELRQGVIVRRGIEHFREQEYVEAEQQFQAAIKLNRSNSWAWYNLGLLYVAQRNWNKALDAFDQGLNGSLRPDWIEVWSYVYRGNCWDMIGQRERAVAEYNKAVSNGNDYDNAQAAAQAFLASPYGKKKEPTAAAEKQSTER